MIRDPTAFKLESIAPPVGRYQLANDILSAAKGKSFGKRINAAAAKADVPGPNHYFQRARRQVLEQAKGELYKQCKRDNNLNSIPSIPSGDPQVYQDLGNGIILSVRMSPVRQKRPQAKGELIKTTHVKQESKSVNPDTDQGLDAIVGSKLLASRFPQPEQQKSDFRNESTKFDSDASWEITQQQTLLLNELEEQTMVGQLSIERLAEISRLGAAKLQPGPGQYELHSMFSKKAAGPKWGKQLRFRNSKEYAKDSFPGPGAYESKLPALGSTPVVGQSNRFEEGLIQAYPGPGSYKLPSLMRSTSQTSTLEYRSVFGSGTKRFLNTLPGEISPGPGSYRIAAPPRRKKKKVFIEIKLDQNLMPLEQQPVDMIWQQDIKLYEHRLPQPKHHNSSSFSSVPRNRQLPDPTDGYLGPGYYDLKPQRVNFNKKSNYFGTAPRR